MTGIVTRLAGGGSASGSTMGFTDGQGFSALFRAPMGVTVDSLRNIFIADTGNNAIRSITSSGL